MKAIALVPGTKDLRLIDRDEPQITGPDEIKMQVLRVGICGTDREEAQGGRAKAPEGHDQLVIGHEMMGRVVEVGKAVTRVRVGDYAVFTVRRGCGECLPCLMNRSDMCLTGRYRERGIWGMDGYQTEYVVDKEQYVIRIPEKISSIGVLTEPLTIAEKAIHEAVRIQFARLPAAAATPDWLVGRNTLVAGLGPVGLLAALALLLHGAKVYGLDIVPPDSARPKWLSVIGGQYINGKEIPPTELEDKVEPMDFIFDATGNAYLELNLLEALGTNGIYMVTGIPGGEKPLKLDGAELVRTLVLKNQILAGSVNASRGHFQMAADDLMTAHLRWPGHVEKLITNRYGHADFQKALTEHPTDGIKSVVEWAAD